MGDQPKGTALVVAGDLNTNLGDVDCDGRGAEIAAAITEVVLEDMVAQRKRKLGRERQTWAMVREGKAVRSRTDYILGTDRSLFRNEAVRDPRHNSDHYMVMGLLRGGTGWEHAKYIAGRRRIPMKPPKRPTQEDELFGDLRLAVLKPQPREQHQNAWISEETCRLVDEWVTMRRNPRARTGMRRLGKAIQVSLKGDRRRRVEEAGTAVETLLQEDPPNARGVWRRMKGWYSHPLELRSSGSRRSKRSCIAGYHPREITSR